MYYYNISIKWVVEDVIEKHPYLTDYEAARVLDYVLENHDANVGINWSVINIAVLILYPNNKK